MAQIMSPKRQSAYRCCSVRRQYRDGIPLVRQWDDLSLPKESFPGKQNEFGEFGYFSDFEQHLDWTTDHTDSIGYCLPSRFRTSHHTW